MSEVKSVENAEINEVPKKKGGCLKGCLTFIVIFIIFGGLIGACFGDEETVDNDVKEESKDNDKKEDKKEDKEEKDKTPKTPEERITNFINKELGKETNNDKKRIVSVGYVAGTLEIILNSDDNLTTNLTRTSMLINASEIFEQLQGYEDVTGDIIVGFMTDLVDQYGNVEADKVLSIRLNQETLDKINFENFNHDNFENIADVYFIHPAIK